MGYASYVAFSSFGLYGLGTAVGLYTDPSYYYYPPYDDSYLLPPASADSDSVFGESPAEDSTEAPGEWVEVPGQWVDGIWVPPHQAWVPETP